MPLGKNVKYRVKNTKKGKVRLAFKDGKVVEAKNLKTGATHTKAEFKKDQKKAKSKKKSPLNNLMPKGKTALERFVASRTTKTKKKY